jgi:hypothetical protein
LKTFFIQGVPNRRYGEQGRFSGKFNPRMGKKEVITVMKFPVIPEFQHSASCKNKIKTVPPHDRLVY